MANGKSIERRGHVVGFREEISRVAKAADDQFFTWFATADGKRDSFEHGQWDFDHHLYGPARPFIDDPSFKVAVEIGHGGGRILAAACHTFGKAIGIDIHDNNERVTQELQGQGHRNFELIRSNGQSIPRESESVDFVYSFIVLQHVERFNVFRNYIEEAARVLRPGGIAVIYFARKYKYSINRGSPWLLKLDRILEGMTLPRGYLELPARVNSTNLVVSLAKAKSVARGVQFEVLESLVSQKRTGDNSIRFGGQNGLVLRKLALPSIAAA